MWSDHLLIFDKWVGFRQELLRGYFEMSGRSS